jgi:branched-chain amino acid transport system permease protein
MLLLFLGLRATRKLHRVLPVVLLFVLFAWVLIDLARAADHAVPPARFVWTNLFSLIARAFDGMLSGGQPVASKLSLWLPGWSRQPACFIVLVVGGGCCAAVMGLIVGMPALRLRGDYLAIATLGMAEIIRILIQNSQPLGGALGLVNIPKYTSFAWLYAFVAITVVVVARVAYSAKGRAIMAVREDEVAASAVGIDTTHHKVMAFVIGSFFGGVAGALFALHERNISPYQFGLAKSIEIVVMVTLGGLGSISGAILAGIVLTTLPELLRPIQEYRMIIYSLALVLMMLLRPQGLLGGIELWPKRRGPRREAVPTEDRDDIGAEGAE